MFSILFFSGILLLNTCNQREIEVSPGRQLYLQAIEEVEFGCPDVNSEFFFEGKLNGQPICFGDNVDNYSSYVLRGTGVQLSSYDGSGRPGSGSWVEFGFRQESFTHLKEEILIASPSDPNESELLDLTQTFLAEGPLPIRDELDPFSGFNIKIHIPYDFPNINIPGKRLFSLQTATGSQENSRLEIVEMNTQETDELLTYDLKIELNCTLYNEISDATDGEYFGELTDGIMRIRFSVPK